MGIKDSLITMMGDFVELKRNPEFRSKTDVAAGTSTGLPPGFKPGRRHSLNITVGTEAPPDKAVRQRTFSVATIDPADLERSRRSSSDTMSLKEPSRQRSPEGSDAPPKPPRQGRRFSEPINAIRQRGLVPERLNLSKKKRPQRPELVSSDDDDGSETVESPRFAGSFSRFSPRGHGKFTMPIQEELQEDEFEAERIAAGTEVAAEIRPNTVEVIRL